MINKTFLFFLLFLITEAFGTSLWLRSSSDQRGLFGGKRAFKVGDLITIDVAESSSLAASQKLSQEPEFTNRKCCPAIPFCK